MSEKCNKFLTKSKIGKKQFHIVNGKYVENAYINPFHSKVDKEILLNILNKKLGKSILINPLSKNNDIFEVVFKDGSKRIISIDTTDHGGRQDLSVKLEIPFNRKGFANAIMSNQQVTIINLFIPLLEDEYGCLNIDEENIIYLILNPFQIYSSKPFKSLVSGAKRVVSPSSRWVGQSAIKETYEKKNFMYFKPKKARKAIIKDQYAYVVHSDQFNEETLKIFETKELEEQIKDWEKYEKYLSKEQLKFVSERWENSAMAKFRQDLIEENGYNCSVENCVKNAPSNQLVASHSRDRASIKNDKNLNPEEIIKKIKNKNNGLLLCAQHDKLYDKGQIRIEENGNLVFRDEVIQYEKYGNKIKRSLLNGERLLYFRYHAENIFIK